MYESDVSSNIDTEKNFNFFKQKILRWEFEELETL